MDRKEFLKKSAGAAAALSVGSLLHAQSEQSPLEEYEFEHYEAIEKEGREVEIIYRFKLGKDVASSKAAVKLEIQEEDYLGDQLSAKYTAETRKVKTKSSGGKEYYEIWSKAYQRQEGPDLLSTTKYKALKGKSCINLYPAESDVLAKIEVLNKKGEVIQEITEHKETSGGSGVGCYLVTMSTAHQGKPKDCYELTTIQQYALNHVLTNEAGRSLLQEYYSYSEKLTAAINKSEHRSTILNQLYDTLVIPTLKLIEESKHSEAKDYYTGYTLQLVEELKHPKGKVIV